MAASPRSFVLASRSPRRRALAEAEGWLVTVVHPPEEAEAGQPPRQPGESLEQYVLRLAWAKAAAVAGVVPHGLLVTCDTVSEVDGQILGKPSDRDDARRMLLALSGKRHRVMTGSCVWSRPAGSPILVATESELEMEPLSPAVLETYLESGLWEGKAGACGYQDEVIPLRLRSGSPSNVVGLPLETLRDIFGRLE